MPVVKIDSNDTGLRYCMEASLGVLPGSPVWYALDPNDYDDFGSEVKTVARRPFNASRQRKKGVVVDLDANGGFGSDFTKTNLYRLMQSFTFSAWREKNNTIPVSGATPIAITSVATADDSFNAASGLDAYRAGDLIVAEGFTNTPNNGIHKVVTAIATKITVGTNLTIEASPPTTAKITRVGFEFGSGEVGVTNAAGTTSFDRLSGTKDFTQFGLVPGEWIFIGGDAAGTQFQSSAKANGFARVKSITATQLVLDKTYEDMVTDIGAAKTIRIWFGHVLKNESDPSYIVRFPVQLERTLGNDGVGVQSEYLIGSVASELEFMIPQADKMTAKLKFIAMNHEQRTGTTGVKAGDRPSLPVEDAFNTSSDISRIRMALVSTSDAAPVPLFAYATEMKLMINNNVSVNKALGILGGFEVTAGVFEVGGDMEAYFADVTAVQAVRNNSDVTIDMVVAKANAGFLVDIPLIALGNGRLKVEQDQPIKLNLEMSAAESSFGHTLLMMLFPYLPTLAEV